MKGKKLPDLFVQFKDGVAWGTYYKRENGKDDGDKFTVARYTPAKPAKVCRWTRDSASIATNGKTACGWWVDRDSQFKFCPRCGGKIRGKR